MSRKIAKKKNGKNKRITKQKLIGMIGMCFSGMVVVIGIVILVMNQIVYQQADNSYDTLRGTLQTLDYEISMEQAQADTEATENGTKTDDTDDTASAEATADSNMSAKFDLLKTVNEDVCAWILQEGSSIDYPVAHGSDNEYYLHHLYTGEKNKLGCIFMDFRNSADFSDKNTVLYGHNMKNGSMFHSITDYKDPDVYLTRPTMTLYTPDGTYLIELFAGDVVSVNSQFLQFNFDTDEDFLDYVAQLRQNSTFESDVEMTAKDQMIMLCTCSYEFTGARYVLAGKLTKIS